MSAQHSTEILLLMMDHTSYIHTSQTSRFLLFWIFTQLAQKSARYYQPHMLHKNLEEQRPHLHHDRGLESYLQTFFRTPTYKPSSKLPSLYMLFINISIFHVIFHNTLAE
jgi:hypothetical protein